jgi:hypothetical protein
VRENPRQMLPNVAKVNFVEVIFVLVGCMLQNGITV